MVVKIKGVLQKVTEFQIEITLEILSLKSQFRYFWKPRTCSYLSG